MNTPPTSTVTARGSVVPKVAHLQHRIGAHAPTPPEVTHRPDTGAPAGNPSRRTGGVIEGNLGAPTCVSNEGGWCLPPSLAG